MYTHYEEENQHKKIYLQYTGLHADSDYEEINTLPKKRPDQFERVASDPEDLAFEVLFFFH